MVGIVSCGWELFPPVSLMLGVGPFVRLFPPGRVLCLSRPPLYVEAFGPMFKLTTGRAFGPHDLRHVARWPAPPANSSLVDSPRQPVGGAKRTGSTSKGVMSSPQKLRGPLELRRAMEASASCSLEGAGKLEFNFEVEGRLGLSSSVSLPESGLSKGKPNSLEFSLEVEIKKFGIELKCEFAGVFR
eukprot:4947932-Amphidinium_carterae.1